MHLTSHHPPRIYLDDTWYLITSSVNGGRRLLAPDGHKEMVRDRLKALVAEFEIGLAAWVILDNHTHILAKSRDGAELNRFLGRRHGRTSYDLNALDNARGRQVWHNFWDACIRSEADYWTRFNYVHYNPVKHRYVKRLEEWPWSSYRYYLEHRGEAWLLDALERYPVIDASDVNDRYDFETG